MNNVPATAEVVVIGAGIVGNSLIHHLAEQGVRGIVQLDKGPLPDPGGSTGHASNFIFPVDHSKEITALTLDSMRQYEELGTLTTCGGIEIARCDERVAELHRRMSSAKAWGVESELIGPERVAELVPFINTEPIRMGFHTPSVAVVDPLRTGAIMRERAQELGALTVCANTEVTGIDTAAGRVTKVRTSRGDIDCGAVVVACGVWSPRIAAMAGANIPLTPAVHQMIDVGPIPILAETRSEIAYPIVRDMDPLMYERQSGADMEVGSYAHRAILHDPDDIPSIAASALSPTQLPFTAEDFDPQMEDALDLFGEVLDAEGAGIRHAINGLLSLTADGAPLLGETVEVKGLWSAAAVWIKEGPGVGRMLAQWMTQGHTEIDLHGADIARFYPHQRTKHHVAERADEGFIKTYGIVHPREQWTSNRPQRQSPFYDREAALGAQFFEVGGWERPQWYESNADLVIEYADRIPDRQHEWDSRWWSPIINAEHLAMRDRVAMIDLSAFAHFDVTGPGAVEYIQGMTVAQMDRPVGRIMYTPVLDESGGFRSDLTVVRLGQNHYRVIAGGADGARDHKWFSDHLPADHSVHLADFTSATCTVGVWGPRARDLLSGITAEDLSDDAFGFATAQNITVDGVPVLALRISYVGELGWELHAPFEQGARLWDAIAAAGIEYGCVPAGIGVYGATGRLEKGYRLMGAELDAEYDPVEAGLALPKIKAAPFIGKEAYLRARADEPAALLCTLTVDDHVDPHGIRRYPQGNEPVLTVDGKRIVDRLGRGSYVTSAGSAPSLGAYLLMTYLPGDYAVEGTALTVEYMGHAYPVTVARVGRKPLFDPEDQRMRRLDMDILVCVKRVPGTGSSVAITADGKNVDTAHLGFTIGPHEECAVEEAIALTETHGGEVTVLTAGTTEAEEQLRYAISMGAHHGVLADIGDGEQDPQATASALTQAIGQLRAEGREFDLMLFGNESADAGNYQVGVRVACGLGLSIVGGIKGIDVDLAARAVQLRRDAPAGTEVFQASLPAAAAVKEGLNLPRYPSVRGRIRSKKTQIRTIEVTARSGGLRKQRLRPAPDKREATVMLGNGVAAAPAIADLLDEIGASS